MIQKILFLQILNLINPQFLKILLYLQILNLTHPQFLKNFLILNPQPGPSPIYQNSNSIPSSSNSQVRTRTIIYSSSQPLRERNITPGSCPHVRSPSPIPQNSNSSNLNQTINDSSLYSSSSATATSATSLSSSSSSSSVQTRPKQKKTTNQTYNLAEIVAKNENQRQKRPEDILKRQDQALGILNRITIVMESMEKSMNNKKFEYLIKYFQMFKNYIFVVLKKWSTNFYVLLFKSNNNTINRFWFNIFLINDLFGKCQTSQPFTHSKRTTKMRGF